MDNKELDQEALRKLLNVLQGETGDEFKNPANHGISTEAEGELVGAGETPEMPEHIPGNLSEEMIESPTEDTIEQLEGSSAEESTESPSEESLEDTIGEKMNKIKDKYFKGK